MKRKPIVNKGWDKNLNVIESIAADVFEPKKKDNFTINFSPFPGPQQRAISSRADELLFGGAAGGGKSFMLIGNALKNHQKSIIFRREYGQLTEIQDTIDELVGSFAKHHAHKHRWTLPDARFLELGAVARQNDWTKYKGRPHDYIGFDELTEFDRLQYRMLIIWNRTSDPNQRCRVIATTNPPTSPEQRWVIDEWAPWLDKSFPDPARAGEVRYYLYAEDTIKWFKTGDPVEVDGKTLYPRSRTFIQAKVTDNPVMMETGYDRILDSLPPELRRAFKDGEFDLMKDEDPYQVFPSAWVEMAMARWREMNSEEGFAPNVGLTSLGVDPTRGGKDETVICPGYGEDYTGVLKYIPAPRVPDGSAVARAVLNELSKLTDTDPNDLEALSKTGVNVIVDIIGIGASVYDELKKLIPVYGFHGGDSINAKDRSGKLGFGNKRAYYYWRLRELLDPANKSMPIALPDDRKLFVALTSIRFKVTVRGIMIEDKDAIRKRLGSSPDAADALVYRYVKRPILIR